MNKGYQPNYDYDYYNDTESFKDKTKEKLNASEWTYSRWKTTCIMIEHIVFL